MQKLRDIEILVQQQLEENEKVQVEDTTLLEIQKILYSTEVCIDPSFLWLSCTQVRCRKASRFQKAGRLWTKKKPIDCMRRLYFQTNSCRSLESSSCSHQPSLVTYSCDRCYIRCEIDFVFFRRIFRLGPLAAEDGPQPGKKATNRDSTNPHMSQTLCMNASKTSESPP